MACAMDSLVPTHSSTASAPTPEVRSLIRPTPASPRSETMSVAPNSSARSWRDLWRLIAMMRSAPMCFAASTPIRPTAPSPTTATVDPACTRAAKAAYHPVPSTSETASRLGIRSSGGTSSVATSVPSASGTRASGAWAPVMNSICSHEDWKPNRQCGQVLSERQKEPTTNWPGRTKMTALPTSSTIPQYSWPMALGPSSSLRPRNGQRSEPQMQEADSRMMASVGLRISGSATSSQRTSRRPCSIVPSIVAGFRVGNVMRAPPPTEAARVSSAAGGGHEVRGVPLALETDAELLASLEHAVRLRPATCSIGTFGSTRCW